MPYPAGVFFKRKNSETPQRWFLDFEAQSGVRGATSASRFSPISALRKLGKTKPMDVRRQCLLFVANFPEGVCVLYEHRRVAHNT